MKYAFLLLFFFSVVYCVSQNEITGTIRAKNELPLEYVNIGVKDKAIGTISNSKGVFHLDVTNAKLNDSLVISYLGFETKILPISHFYKERILYLNEKITELDEVIVSNKELKKGKRKRKGYKSKSKSIITGWNNYSKGEESGLIIKNNNKNIKIEKICFQLAHNTFETAKMRLRIRNVTNKFPSEDILLKNIYIDVNEPNNYCIDVSEYEIYTKNDFFVGLELIFIGKRKKDNQKRDLIALSGSLTGKLYYKEASASKWIKHGLPGPSIQVQLVKF